MNAVFLDFDGVLFDTAFEAYLVCCNMNSPEIFFSINTEDPFYICFRKYRYLVGEAWQFYYLQRAITHYLANTNADIKLLFAQMIATAERVDYQAFEERFFGTRRKLQTIDYESWMQSNRPYDFFTKLKPVMEKFRQYFYIISAKDADTIQHILKAYDFEIPRNHLFGVSQINQFGSKKNILTRHINRFPDTPLLFVDDYLQNILDCSDPPQIMAYHAQWGYVPPENARDNTDELIGHIFTFLGNK